MTIKTTVTSEPDPTRAARALREGLEGVKPAFVIFFASSAYDPETLGRAMGDAFSGVPSIGCTTAGELHDGKMLKGSISLLAFDASELTSVSLATVEDTRSRASVEAALEQLSEGAGAGIAALDPNRYVGLVLHDGMAVAEEAVMEVLSSATNVPFVGGSAGDDAKFKTTWVFVNGRAKTGGAVLALLQPARPFGILKTQSFDVLETTLQVTDVDESTRTVRRFNDRPAAEEYARALGTTPDKLAEFFMASPLGLVMQSGEPFVRSPQQIRGTDVVFYCQVKAGMNLHVLEARDIVEDTRRDLERRIAEMGGCRGVLNFHCILRTLELEAKKQCDAYGAVFSKVPTAGFSTYGESYIGHINQTSTMVLFS